MRRFKPPIITQEWVDQERQKMLSLSPNPPEDQQDNRWVELIKNAKVFNDNLKKLSDLERKKVFNQLHNSQKNYWVELIKTKYDFYLVMDLITDKDKTTLFDQLHNSQKNYWVELIKNAQDFLFLRGLSDPQRKKVFYQLHNSQDNYWGKLIKTKYDFYWVMQVITDKDKTTLLNQLLNPQDNYSYKLIEDIQDLQDTLRLKCLTDSHCQIICKSLREQKPSLFTDENTFNLLNSLPEEKCLSVCQTLLYDRSRLREFVHFLGKDSINQDTPAQKTHIKSALYRTYEMVRKKEQKKFLGIRGLFSCFFESYSLESKIKAAQGAIENQLNDSDKKALNEGLLGKIHQLRT